jgi:hypothetical protein
MLPLIPIAVVGLGGLAIWKSRKHHGMTPARKKIYETALRTLKDPEKLRTLAKAFDKEGLKDEAIMLRKRALLREMPPDIRAKRQEVFSRAMASKNPAKVENVAQAFHKEGAVGAAANLRKYAAGLRKAS